VSKQARKDKEDEAPLGGVRTVEIVLGLVAVGGLVVGGLGFQRARSLEQKVNLVETKINELAKGIQTLVTQAQAQQQQRRGPDPNRVYPVNTTGSPSKGAPAAPIVIAEFSDFQCPFCSRVGPTLDRVMQVYGDRVRIVWKHNPLAMHKDAPLAHLASVAAADQGKFWQYHDKLFANQQQIQRNDLIRYAAELGLDTARFQQTLESDQHKARVSADANEAQSLGVTGTPAFFVNGRYLSGAQPFEKFAQLINAELQRLGIPPPPGASVGG
jgi:protein-disulfide isomerase